MEEYVGQLWHQWITQAANQAYPQEAVYLTEMQQSLAIVFRAFGGDAGLEVVNSLKTAKLHQRTWLQRIAGTAKRAELAWRDQDKLNLPLKIELFPEKALNRDLYLWLTLLATVDIPIQGSWLAVNCQKVHFLLTQFPTLKSRYQRLVQAHLAQRPLFKKNAPQYPIEQQICQALKDPALFVQVVEPAIQLKKKLPPVPLWLYPQPPSTKKGVLKRPLDEQEGEDGSKTKQLEGDNKKRKAERVDNPDGKDGFLGIRMENIFSWSEFVNVDRTTDDDEDPDALSTANDMDKISVAQDTKKSSSKLKLNLDLPSEEYDDIRLGEGIPLPEWDYKKQLLQPEHCHLQLFMARDAKEIELPQALKKPARILRRQFEILRPQRRWVNRQNEGSELDLEYYIAQLAERKQGKMNADMPIFKDFLHYQRSLSCLLLADLSLSTDTWINNQARIIDVIQDSLFLFAEALSSTQDRFALYGFSSRYRQHIRFHQIKSFKEMHSNQIRGRIASIKPGYYTRMGAAIRYASDLLAKEQSQQRLLLILTDGKPNDLDKYEGRYGTEDTRQAILECKKAGIKPFCVTIDAASEDYLPYLFGHQSYAFIQDAVALPKKLAMLYARLTHE